MENKEKIEVQILGINVDADVIKYSYNGEEKTATVVAPADIKYARQGKATIQLNDGGMICYIRAIKEGSNFNNNFKKPNNYNYANGTEEKKHYVSKVKVAENLTLIELQETYNDFAKDHWVKASNIFETKEGTYNMVMFYSEEQ